MTANRVAPWLDDGDLTLYHGDALTVLQGLPAGIAQTCVTSPPYWGLRDYGTGQWSGGDAECEHRHPKAGDLERNLASSTLVGTGQSHAHNGSGTVCRCGARRVDSQLGLEATPTLYVENMVALFREVWRVLRDDGTLWLNLGDSYASDMKGDNRSVEQNLASSGLNVSRDRSQSQSQRVGASTARRVNHGLKPKDLVGIPWRVAFALQADGWYLRSDIIWSKPNPMPESVTDRPTKAHEYLFLLTKQPRYFYDADAIREPAEYGFSASTGNDWRQGNGSAQRQPERGSRTVTPGDGSGGRNRRSVWTIPTQRFPEAHFATYPEELVRPCILAGTSEKGECSTCGAPWVRQTETRIDESRAPARRNIIEPQVTQNGQGTNAQGSSTWGHYLVHDTVGWEPSCRCHGGTAGAKQNQPDGSSAGDRAVSGRHEGVATLPAATRPQLVLDPFAGSGTTSLVARKHGRRSIGIDLSAEYLEIAAKRTQQLSLLGGAA